MVSRVKKQGRSRKCRWITTTSATANLALPSPEIASPLAAMGSGDDGFAGGADLVWRMTPLAAINALGSRQNGFIPSTVRIKAGQVKFLDKEDHLKGNCVENNEGDQTISLFKAPYCRECCILQARLVVSFGVWCVHHILDLLLVENRPELWGKYTYVLNSLQGILNPDFYKPRPSKFSCKCLPLPQAILRSKENLGRAQFTSARTILELIKNVEVSIYGHKGQAGTAAGNIAFPKGKENLASVFRRYKRRLSETSS